MNKIGSIIISVFVIGVLLVSCEEENSEPEIPVIPPQTTLKMDFSDFVQVTKSASTEKMIISNHTYAATNVIVWNAIATVYTAIPVAAFAESFNHDPVFKGDKIWQWDYSVSVAGVNYHSRLEGEVLTDSVEWRMFISIEGSGEGNGFLWFKGRSASDRSAGWWILYEKPAAPNEALKIEWENLGNEQGQLRYTVVKPEAEQFGSYIQFRRQITNDSPYDSFYSISLEAENQDLLIEWNSDTKEGRVKKYSDESWSCWNSELIDTVCE